MRCKHVPDWLSLSWHCTASVLFATSVSTACSKKGRSRSSGQVQTPGYMGLLCAVWALFSRAMLQMWFNIFVIHQNRVRGRGEKNYIPHTFIPEFMVRVQLVALLGC